MKVSKEQKEKTRQVIVQTAVDLITEGGYHKTTMKNIARQAGVGDATIYKYFSSKEKILLAYYELKAQETIATIKKIDSFAEFSLQEKLQTLINTYLEKLLPDREFVSVSLKIILYTPLFLFRDIVPVKHEFHRIINEFLDTARENKEISSFPFDNLITGLLGEYIMGVILYWLADRSDEFANTTQMIDLSLSLGMTILESRIIDRVTEIFSFLIKSHLLSFMADSSNFLHQLKRAQRYFK